jgi:SAM-dependent methyltransferase
MKHHQCPSCKSSSIRDFFRIANAPIQSLLTVKSKAEALEIPETDIDLCFCQDCGFVFNSSFDTSYDYYTRGYEDQQGFSPTFRNFITGITNRFIERYDMRNKHVLEIGCGKGDFISLFCELGNNRGIGIDPAWVPGRIAPNPDLRFITEFYSEAHGNLPADCICCRHTLEHIHATDEFIGTIRRSLGSRKDVVVFMEVPSIVRILKVQAFWDIFNEHCSYFSPGSLARLFRKNNFEVLDLYLEYDEQYLFIEARPVDQKSGKVHPLEEPVEELSALTRDFATSVRQTLDTWRSKLQLWKLENKKVVIWGGGSKSVGFLTNFNDIGVIDYVVDINPHMQHNFIPGIGKEYVGPDFLREYKPDVVIIMNGVYLQEISKTIHAMGLSPELYPL